MGLGSWMLKKVTPWVPGLHKDKKNRKETQDCPGCPAQGATEFSSDPPSDVPRPLPTSHSSVPREYCCCTDRIRPASMKEAELPRGSCGCILTAARQSREGPELRCGCCCTPADEPIEAQEQDQEESQEERQQEGQEGGQEPEEREQEQQKNDQDNRGNSNPGSQTPEEPTHKYNSHEHQSPQPHHTSNNVTIPGKEEKHDPNIHDVPDAAHNNVNPHPQDFASEVSSEAEETTNYRTLTTEEYASLLDHIGAQDPTSCPNDPKPIHPKNKFWPPKDMPRGLYRDILTQKTKYAYLYYGVTALQWTGVIVQIVLGAFLGVKTKTTIAGCMGHNNNGHGKHQDKDDGKSSDSSSNPDSSTSGEESYNTAGSYAQLTALIVGNAVNAALVAVLRHMNLIQRYRMIKDEFARVENDIRRVVDTGVVREEMNDANDVAVSMYKRYERACCKVARMSVPVPFHEKWD